MLSGVTTTLDRLHTQFIIIHHKQHTYIHGVVLSSLQAISRCNVETMAVKTTSAGAVVLALGTTAGEVFVVAVTAMESLVWVALDTGTSKATVKRWDDPVCIRTKPMIVLVHVQERGRREGNIQD